MTDYAKQLDELELATQYQDGLSAVQTETTISIARALLKERDELLSYKRSVAERVNVCVGCDNWGKPRDVPTVTKPFTVEVP